MPVCATDQVHIRHRLDGSEDLLIRVFDGTGRQLDHYRFRPYDLAAGSLITLDVAGYEAGTYFVNFVLDGKNSGSVKFVKE